MAESTVSYVILQLMPRSYFILVGKALEQCITCQCNSLKFFDLSCFGHSDC